MRKLPYYVISALKKGLELHSKGLSGDGLRPSTVSAARRAVNTGSWSDEKIKKASAWLARHRFDRARMKSPSKWDDPPKYSPAYVAWLLWGDSGDGKGRSWIDKHATKIRRDEDTTMLEDVKDVVSIVVKQGEANVYKIDGVNKASVSLDAGSSLVVDVSDPSNNGHPMSFSRTADGTHSDGKELRGRIERQGSAGSDGSFIKFNPSESGNYFYFCRLHKGMGGSIKVSEPSASSLERRHSATPAPPSDRVKGGRNTGRAGTSGKGIVLSKSTVKAIQNKVDSHNKTHGNDKRKRATPSMLKKVYLRGAGAFSTSHRPSVTSRAQWAMARVNAFLYLLSNLKPKRSAYISDNDLLPKSHPRSSSAKESVENPSKDQRTSLPSEAYSPCDYHDEDGNFLVSKSKLPHHVKTVNDPNEHDSVDLPRLRNALARFGQTDFSQFPPGTKARARAHLERHADALLRSRRSYEDKDPHLGEIISLLERDIADFRNGDYHLIAKRINNEA